MFCLGFYLTSGQQLIDSDSRFSCMYGFVWKDAILLLAPGILKLFLILSRFWYDHMTSRSIQLCFCSFIYAILMNCVGRFFNERRNF